MEIIVIGSIIAIIIIAIVAIVIKETKDDEVLEPVPEPFVMMGVGINDPILSETACVCGSCTGGDDDDDDDDGAVIAGAVVAAAMDDDRPDYVVSEQPLPEPEVSTPVAHEVFTHVEDTPSYEPSVSREVFSHVDYESSSPSHSDYSGSSGSSGYSSGSDSGSSYGGGDCGSCGGGD